MVFQSTIIFTSSKVGGKVFFWGGFYLKTNSSIFLIFLKSSQHLLSAFDTTIELKVLHKLLTTHGEVHCGGTEYDAVLLVDGYLTVSSQIIKTALRNTKKHAMTQTQTGHTR